MKNQYTKGVLTTEQLAKRWGVLPQSLVNNRYLGRGVKFVKRPSIVYKLEDVVAFEKKQKLK